jgi:hypothetical protein
VFSCTDEIEHGHALRKGDHKSREETEKDMLGEAATRHGDAYDERCDEKDNGDQCRSE